MSFLMHVPLASVNSSKQERLSRKRHRYEVILSSVALIAFCSLPPVVGEVYRTSQMIGVNTGNLGAVGTSEGWESSSGQVTIENGSGSLDGTALGLTPSAGDKANVGASDGFSTRNLFAGSGQFPVSSARNLYYSFLYQFSSVADVSPDGERIAQVNRQNSGSAFHFAINAKEAGGTIQIGVNKPLGEAVYAPVAVNEGETVFVVVRQQMIVGGGDDVIDLWVNPPREGFGAGAENVPAPAVSTSDGTEDTSNTGPGRFYVVSGANALFDELRIASTWAEVTPTPALCNPALVTLDPTNQTVTAGISVSLTVTAEGTSPSYQWQVSRDGGNSWANVADGSGGFTSTYSTAPLTVADHGNQYRCVVSVSCGGGSTAISAAAAVTVLAPVSTPPGIVVDDEFNDGTRNGDVFSVNNSIWFASNSGSLDASSAVSMTGLTLAGSSVLWVGYFTDDLAMPQLPVHLDVGNSLKVTLSFTPLEVAVDAQNLRLGLFDYADGGTRIAADGFGSGSTGNGQNVRGYMLNLNFGAIFTTGEPLEILARNNLTSVNLMGTTGGYRSLGSGPDGESLAGLPAFVDGTPYTLEFVVERSGPSEVNVTTTITGEGAAWSHTVTDGTFGYHRFDAFAIRPNTMEGTASRFDFSRFKVEVIGGAAPFRITAVERLPAGSVRLTWDAAANATYEVQARDSVSSGDWAVVGTVTASSNSASFTDETLAGRSQRYYRIVR
jgi:hypothetical protein